MAMQIKEYDIEIDYKIEKPKSDIIVVKGDRDTNLFHIKITDCGRWIPLGDSITNIKVIFQDYARTNAIMECSATNNIIDCLLSDEVMNLMEGTIKMEVQLFTAISRLSTMNYTFTMQNSLLY